MSNKGYYFHRLFFSLIIVCLTGGVYYFFRYYQKAKDDERRENLIWHARSELEAERGDKSFEFITLDYVKYEDYLLKVYFSTSNVTKKTEMQLSDSIILNDLFSFVVAHVDNWQSICKYLIDAEVDMSVSFTNYNRPIIVTGKQLLESLNDYETINRGLILFSNYKAKEVFNYAKIHFAKDRFFKVDSVSMDDNYVCLYLQYDDNKAELGYSFLNKYKVSAHFTDKVGNMGSILDGMLSICGRTDRGFSFVYKAKKSGKIKRNDWDATRAKTMFEETNNKLWLDNRKTNQVRTVIYKTNK